MPNLWQLNLNQNFIRLRKLFEILAGKFANIWRAVESQCTDLALHFSEVWNGIWKMRFIRSRAEFQKIAVSFSFAIKNVLRLREDPSENETKGA